MFKGTLKPYQVEAVEKMVEQKRILVAYEMGLGKTPMQLVWADHVIARTHKPVLILTPLAVGAQTGQEAKKFGIEAVRSRASRAKTPCPSPPTRRTSPTRRASS